MDDFVKGQITSMACIFKAQGVDDKDVDMFMRIVAPIAQASYEEGLRVGRADRLLEKMMG